MFLDLVLLITINVTIVNSNDEGVEIFPVLRCLIIIIILYPNRKKTFSTVLSLTGGRYKKYFPL